MVDPGPNEPEKVMNGACEARALIGQLVSYWALIGQLV